MAQFFNGLSSFQTFFLICAIIGCILFIVRLFLQMIGGGHDSDMNIEVGHADVMHTDTDSSFKILTIQGLTFFFLMFGLVGFALSWGNSVNGFFVIIGALIAGFCSVWVLGKLLTLAKQLQSSGTIENESAIGSEGTVYLSIMPEKIGKVMITVKGRLREFNAVSTDSTELKTGTPIRVISLNGNILVVEKNI